MRVIKEGQNSDISSLHTRKERISNFIDRKAKLRVTSKKVNTALLHVNEVSWKENSGDVEPDFKGILENNISKQSISVRLVQSIVVSA